MATMATMPIADIDQVAAFPPCVLAATGLDRGGLKQSRDGRVRRVAGPARAVPGAPPVVSARTCGGRDEPTVHLRPSARLGRRRAVHLARADRLRPDRRVSGSSLGTGPWSTKMLPPGPRRTPPRPTQGPETAADRLLERNLQRDQSENSTARWSRPTSGARLTTHARDLVAIALAELSFPAQHIRARRPPVASVGEPDPAADIPTREATDSRST
jgi:hypothetical protein